MHLHAVLQVLPPQLMSRMHCCYSLSSLQEFVDEASDVAVAPIARKPHQLLAGQHGWKLSASFTSPLVGHVGSEEITFGEGW